MAWLTVCGALDPGYWQGHLLVRSQEVLGWDTLVGPLGTKSGQKDQR